MYKKQDRRVPPQTRRCSKSIEKINRGSDDAFANHDCWGVAGAVPGGFTAAGLGGEAEMIEVFAEEFVVELGEKLGGCRGIDADDFFDHLLAAHRGGGCLGQWFTG